MPLTEDEKEFLRGFVADFIYSLDPTELADPANAEEKLAMGIRKISPTFSESEIKKIIEETKPKGGIPEKLTARSDISERMISDLEKRIRPG